MKREPLVVRDIRVEETGDSLALSARLECPGVDLPSTAWFHYPRDLAPFVVSDGDPFFPVALLAAMRHGRRLVIEGDVSAALLGASSRVMRNYRALGPDAPSFEQVEVVAAPVPRRERGRTAGVFFSGGVDSFYTLLGNIARYPAQDSRAISHLVLVHGFDISLRQQAFFETVRGRLEDVAQTLGKTLVTVRTNVRDVVRAMDWAHHGVGAAMAGVGLSLGRLFHTLSIAAARTFVDLRPAATGCHPGLDPLWSTETLEFVHAGAEANRGDKVAMLATSPLALGALRVCWYNPGDVYNCGQCEKCLRTMVLLDLHDALGRTGHFPHRVLPADIAALDLRIGWWGWPGILARVRAAGGRQEIAEAIETALARCAWRRSRLGRVGDQARRALGEVGLSPARIQRLDRVVLGGLVTRLFQKSRRALVLRLADGHP